MTLLDPTSRTYARNRAYVRQLADEKLRDASWALDDILSLPDLTDDQYERLAAVLQKAERRVLERSRKREAAA